MNNSRPIRAVLLLALQARFRDATVTELDYAPPRGPDEGPTAKYDFSFSHKRVTLAVTQSQLAILSDMHSVEDRLRYQDGDELTKLLVSELNRNDVPGALARAKNRERLTWKADS